MNAAPQLGPGAGIPSSRYPRMAAVFTAALFATSALAANPAAMLEINRLMDSGVAEDTIVAFVRSHHRNYELTVDDVIALRERGVPAVVLNAMLESGDAPGVPATALSTSPPAAPEPGPAAMPAAPPADQDVAYFRQELSPYGRWLLSDENQWYWQPTVAVGRPAWRPYWDQGRWVYTDHGWYWSSDYPWGWAAFHYGRWSLHPHHGWIWYPDREWAPAWVTWRMGGEYCGWSPLPPFSHFDHVRGGLSFHGSHVEANFGFGLEWAQFNFTYLREMGDRPRTRFRREADARRVFSQTTIINNYTVARPAGGGDNRPRVVNQGIDPARVGALRGKAVETVRIQDRRISTPVRAAERVDTRKQVIEVYRPQLAPTPPSRVGQPAVPPHPRVTGAPIPADTRPGPPAAVRPPPPAAAPTPVPRTAAPPPRGSPPVARPGTPGRGGEPNPAVGGPSRSEPGKPATPPRTSPGRTREDPK